MSKVSDRADGNAAPALDGSDADLKRLIGIRFPDWNIIRSNVGRWWAFRVPSRDNLDRTSDVDADTPSGLYLKLLEVERQ